MNYISQKIEIAEKKISKDTSIKSNFKAKSRSRDTITKIGIITILAVWIFSSIMCNGLFLAEAVITSFILVCLLLIKGGYDPKIFNQKTKYN